MAEFEQRRTKDVRELEQRLGLLLDGRSKDLTARVTAELEARAGALDTRRGEQSRETDARYLGALETRSKELEGRVQALLDARAKELEARISNQLSMSRTALDERLTQLSKRLEVDREARFSEISETNSKSLAGLQVRMQSYLDQKMREDTDRERSKYVELLARLKGEVDDALGRTIDSTRFDAAVRDRVQRAMDDLRRESARGLAELETRLSAEHGVGGDRLSAIEQQLQQRTDAIADVEAKVRQDVEDLDRRVQVVTEKIVPLVRKTWVRIEEVEKMLGRTDESEVRLGQLRRDVGRELRRVEGELREEQAHLRRRLESSMTNQSKIWLNLVRQLSEAGAGTSRARRTSTASGSVEGRAARSTPRTTTSSAAPARGSRRTWISRRSRPTRSTLSSRRERQPPHASRGAAAPPGRGATLTGPSPSTCPCLPTSTTVTARSVGGPAAPRSSPAAPSARRSDIVPSSPGGTSPTCSTARSSSSPSSSSRTTSSSGATRAPVRARRARRYVRPPPRRARGSPRHGVPPRPQRGHWIDHRALPRGPSQTGRWGDRAVPAPLEGRSRAGSAANSPDAPSRSIRWRTGSGARSDPT